MSGADKELKRRTMREKLVRLEYNYRALLVKYQEVTLKHEALQREVAARAAKEVTVAPLTPMGELPDPTDQASGVQADK